MKNDLVTQTARRDKVRAEVADMDTYIAGDEFSTLSEVHQNAIMQNRGLLSLVGDTLDIRLAYLTPGETNDSVEA